MGSSYKRIKAFILSIVLFFGTLSLIGCFVMGIKNKRNSSGRRENGCKSGR